jgi:hypothetical protein
VNKILETHIRALIGKERMICHLAFPSPWRAVHTVIFYALAPFAKYPAVSEYLKDAKLFMKFYPDQFKGVEGVTSEAQGVKDFLYDLERTVDNSNVMASMAEQMDVWLEAYSLLLDACRRFRDDGKLYSHFDMKVRSMELGNESPAVDVNVLGKVLMQTDPDRLATLLNSSFRGQDSNLKAFVASGIPTDAAEKIPPLSRGVMASYANLLAAMLEHIKHLKTLPARAFHSSPKQRDEANNRKKGDGKAGLNTRRHGKPKDADNGNKPGQRRQHGKPGQHAQR